MPTTSFPKNSLLVSLVVLLLLSSSFLSRETHGFGIGPSSSTRRTFSLKVKTLDLVEEKRIALKDEVLGLVTQVPKNKRTPRRLTRNILRKVTELERTCPTPDDQVLENLDGHWELLWTAQDRSSKEWRRLPYLALPLENQIYSNNPDGDNRNFLGFFLPRFVLERIWKRVSGRKVDASARSTQSIDVEKQFVRNVVNFENKNRKGSVTIDIHIAPSQADPRRVDIRCDACELDISDGRVNLSFPLGVLGPRGWLRTVYIDDTIRIARGQKGSVFVLERTPTEENTTTTTTTLRDLVTTTFE